MRSGAGVKSGAAPVSSALLLNIQGINRRPGADYRLHQRCQWNCEENPPQPPESSEYQDRHDNGDRMQIYRFGKQYGNQNVAIQNLDNEIGNGQRNKFAAPTPLKPGNQNNRESDHSSTDVGNNDRESDQHPK